MDRISFWLKEIRAPFLSLPVVLVFPGTSIAFAQGAFDLWQALLALAGLVALHISVNVLNEYSDFEKTGIDLYTSPTPFSGGSGVLVAGRIAPSGAYAVGIGSLAFGAGIGILFPWLTQTESGSIARSKRCPGYTLKGYYPCLLLKTRSW